MKTLSDSIDSIVLSADGSYEPELQKKPSEEPASQAEEAPAS